jgi:hypothetical protein
MVATRAEMLNSLHDQAWAFAQKGTPAAIETAIMLHGQVVHRRAADDPHRVECLRTHARLLHHYGRSDAALMYMEAAGTQAATEGRDFEAAIAFIEAAILADELGQTETVRRLTVDANRILTNSSELDSVERVAIRSRLGL